MFFMEKNDLLSLNYPCYPYLSGALNIYGMYLLFLLFRSSAEQFLQHDDLFTAH